MQRLPLWRQSSGYVTVTHASWRCWCQLRCSCEADDEHISVHNVEGLVLSLVLLCITLARSIYLHVSRTMFGCLPSLFSSTPLSETWWALPVCSSICQNRCPYFDFVAWYCFLVLDTLLGSVCLSPIRFLQFEIHIECHTNEITRYSNVQRCFKDVVRCLLKCYFHRIYAEWEPLYFLGASQGQFCLFSFQFRQCLSVTKKTHKEGGTSQYVREWFRNWHSENRTEQAVFKIIWQLHIKCVSICHVFR